jgi:protoporphyrinogen/coproporphyrinogen III oxidase
MRVVVVGAGPAGLTAGYRLQRAGHEVVILEANDVAGGRTHTEHFGPGHWADTGAGWLASFYPDTLRLLDEIGERRRLQPLRLRGGGDLLLDGHLVPNPNSMARILATPLLRPAQKLRFLVWMAQLIVRQPGGLRTDDRWDGVTALDALRPAGRAAIEQIVRPSFEGPFFARLDEMSGALVRAWLRDLSIGSFFHVDGGMDAPWRALGDRLGVRTGVRVTGLRETGAGVEVLTADGEIERADGVVVALPAPLAAELAPDHPASAILREIRYVPHVRLYAARRAAGPPRTGVHAFPNDIVATVELGTGRDGAWGQVPAEWQWELICAPAASSGPLVALSDEEASDRLWTEASTIDPRIFPLDDAEVRLLVRWPHAVPVVDPGYHARLRRLRQQPPIVFCGDWLVQPCVEGAVRSGAIAAGLLGPA